MNSLIKHEFIRESLIAVVDEMRANVIHASYSSIITEGHDFSCAVLTADGRIVAQSLADHPIHSLSVPFATREIVRAFGDDIRAGDVFLHNDPYTGGTHLNDVLMLYPVFSGNRLALFAAVRCHWGDVGGMTAGSLSGQVTEILQEGIRIPPTRICSRGEMNEPFLELLFNNMRLPTERRGDFNTMVGTCWKAAEHLQRLFVRFGGTDLLQLIEELFSRSEQALRRRLSECPAGVYRGEGYIESNGITPEPLVARLELTIAKGTLNADFTGSSPQTAGATNSGPAIPLTAVVGIVKAFLDPDTPINHGSIVPLNVVAPPGTFLNARPPAPCGGMAEVKYLLDTVVAAAFGQVVPELMVGDFKGTGNHVYIAGNGAQGRDYLLYEWPAGGTGASRGTDGNNAVRGFSEGDFGSIHPVEVVERSYPLRVDRCELRVGSCGDGEYRGGLGLSRELRVLEGDARLSVLSEKNIIPPYGVAGGGSGAPNRFTVVRNGKTVPPSRIPGKISGFQLCEGDVIREQSAGGGGCGDPLARDPILVQRDVRAGYLTMEQARDRYGVVLDDRLEVIQRATIQARNDRRAARVYGRVRSGEADVFEGSRRLFAISPSLAGQSGIEPNALMELCAPKAAALRGWARVDPTVAQRVVIVGPSGLLALRAVEDEVVEIRRIPAVPL